MGNIEKVLVVDDDPMIVLMLEHALKTADFHVLKANDGETAWGIFRAERPFLLLTDVEMPGGDGVSLLRRVKDEDPDTIVVVITGSESEDYVIETLRAGGDNFLKKPLDLPPLLTMVREYREIASRENFLKSARRSLDRLDLSLTLPSDPDLLASAAQLIEHEVEPFLKKDDRLAVRLGVYEMLQNALEHGNFEMTSADKAAVLEKGGMADRLRELRAHPVLGKRMIFVKLTADAGQCQIAIRDEGKGFDWRGWLDAGGADRLMDASGRGLLITRVYFDKLHYNEAGNEVTLVKRLSS